MEIAASFPHQASSRSAPWVALSASLHAIALLALAYGSRLVVPATLEPIRVTLIESAPPPPPLGGPPSIAPAPVAPAPVPIPQSAPEPRPIKIAKKPQPSRREKEPAPPSLPAAQAPPSDVSGSSVGAVGGEIGGVAGGQVGGTVGGRGDRVFRAGEVASPPTIVSQTLPTYPPVARARGIEGLVVLESVIDRKGRVESDSVTVVQSIPMLDDAAMSALREWHFRAGRDDHGDPVRVIVQVPIRFRLR